MYFGVGGSGKGYSSLPLPPPLSLSLSVSTHTHTDTVGEMGNVKFLTIVVRKCVEFWRGGGGIFLMKIKMVGLWLQIKGTKLIFIVNISVLDFYKFASRMPQIAQILVSTFKIFQGSMPLDPPRNFLFFFAMSNSRLWILDVRILEGKSRCVRCWLTYCSVPVCRGLHSENNGHQDWGSEDRC